MTEGAQPKTVIPDNRPIREPQTIEEIESGIEGALEGEALEEKVVAVEEELFDLGVYEPTNVQELAYFKEDLNVLISDLEIQIPPEVLKGVVENVIARVTSKPTVLRITHVPKSSKQKRLWTGIIAEDVYSEHLMMN